MLMGYLLMCADSDEMKSCPDSNRLSFSWPVGTLGKGEGGGAGSCLFSTHAGGQLPDEKCTPIGLNCGAHRSLVHVYKQFCTM